jgi:hypothetical protein
LTADEAAKANKWLNQRSWTLVEVRGVWQPVKTI